MKSTAKKRKHAALIRITARESKDRQLPLVLAHADKLEAEADLEDALAGIDPETADHADVEQNVPVLGRMVFAAGKIKSMQRAWLEEEEMEAKRRGIMLTWMWSSSPHSENYGLCTGFYAGTRDSGPLVHWSAADGYWRRLYSKGDYGKKWACGGHWQVDLADRYDQLPQGAKILGNKVVYESFHDSNGELFEAVMNILKQGNYREKVKIAREKLKAATLKMSAERARCRQQTQRKPESNMRNYRPKAQHA